MISMAYQDQRSEPLISRGFLRIAGATVSLPVFGFFVCILLSVINDFEQSTATHCRVRNYLPSASAAFGDASPQRYVWRVVVALHLAPRLLALACSYALFCRLRPTGGTAHAAYTLGVVATCGLHLAEIAALVALTYVSSRENYKVHEASFYLYQGCSLVHQLVHVKMFKMARENSTWTIMERRSYTWKWRMMTADFSASFLAAYFFYRHNKYCEPGVYSMFALMEYVIILSGTAFHYTLGWDLNQYYLLITQHPTLGPLKTCPPRTRIVGYP